jgi:hypothetical protein
MVMKREAEMMQQAKSASGVRQSQDEERETER